MRLPIPPLRSVTRGHTRRQAFIHRSKSCVAAYLSGMAALLIHVSLQAAANSATDLKKLSIDELMNLEVTSVSRHPERLSETASAIQVITQDDIRRSGATSLPEALRLATNLQVAQIDSRQWAISARGFNSTTSNKLLVLIDGRTVYTPLYAGVFWDVQNTLLEDVERIEVISGPGATLWGTNAVNGVINITTKKAVDTQGALLSAGGGTDLRDFAGLRYGGSVGSDVQYRVYGKYFQRDGSVLPDDRDVANDWHMSEGGFRVDGTISQHDALSLQGDVYDGRVRQPTADDIVLNGGNLTGQWQRTMSDRSDLKLQIYFDRTHRDIPGSYAENLNTYNLDFQHRFAVGERHDIVWGWSYRLIEDDIRNPVTFGFLPPTVTQRWYGAFLQDEIALLPEYLNLTLGTKIEHNDYTGFEFQPSVRLAWRLQERQTLWAAVSRAVRTPSRVDRELYVPSSPPFVVLNGGSGFQSEKLVAYELGYRAQAYERLTVALSTFYNDYDDLRSIERIRPPAQFPVFIGNGLTAQSYGAELTADYQATNFWRLRAGYTEFRIHFGHEPGSTDANPGTSESHDPEQQFLIRSSLDLLRNCQFDATYRHVSRIANQAVPAYGELDLRVSWQPIAALELSVVGQNLLHDHHAEFGAINAANLANTRKEIERSVYGKAVWRY